MTNQIPSYQDLEKKIQDLENKIENISDIGEKLNQIFYHSQVATEIYDIEGRLIECNPACLSMFGIENIDMVKGFNLFNDPNLSEEQKNKIKSGIEVRFEMTFDFELVKTHNLYKTSKEGIYIYDCIIRPYYQNKLIQGYLVLLLDITNQIQTKIELKNKNKLLEDKNALLEESLLKIQQMNHDLIAAKEEAEQNEAKFKSYFTHSLDGVFITDENGNYIEVNPSASIITGYSKDELCTMNIQQIVPEEDIPQAFEHFKRVIEHGQSIAEIRFMKKDKSIGYWIVEAIKLSETRILGFVKDITKPKESENIIRQHNDRLKILVDLSQMANLTLDEIYNFALKKAIELSHSKMGLFGFLNKEETIVNIHAWPATESEISDVKVKFIDFEVQKRGIWKEVIKQRKAIIVNDFSLDNIIKNSLPAGHFQIRNYLSIPIFEKGKIKAVFAVGNKETDYSENDIQELILLMDGVWNIVKQRNYEKELILAKESAEENEDWHKSILQTAMDGFWRLDIKGNILEINDAYIRMSGYTEKELLSMNISDLEVSESLSNSLIHFQKIKEIGQDRFETVHRRKDGSTYLLEISSQYKAKDGGNMVAFMRDITLERNKEIELKSAIEKAEESDRLKTSFLNNMSHEVRTPLNAIVGFSNFITKPNQSPEKLKIFSDLISTSSDKLIGIITDVIEISQIHTNQFKADLVGVDIIKFLSFIVDGFAQKAIEKKLELKLILNIPHKEYLILADIEKLKRIFNHLLDNAIKFTQKGKVEIICDLSGSNLQVSVSDTGIGITEEMQEIIFHPFRQGETGKSRVYGGNGLGLAIVKAYIELLKGTISLKSEPNIGTTFIIELPAVNTFIQTTQKSDPQITYSAKTILIAEDEYSNYLYLVEFLETFGLEILHASDGQQALDMCRNNKSIDLILMDIKMPIMDGHTAAKLIKEFRPLLPIVAQTAYALKSEITSYSNDFDDYITKPIDENELKKILMKYINY